MDMQHRLLMAGLLVATCALGACGEDDPVGGSAAPTGATAVAVAARPAYLERHDLALAVGNGVRARLDQLAVMQQPPDAASDLGQSLPAGLLRDVSCAPDGARPSGGQTWTWRC